MGFKRYFPASMCAKGHIDERSTINGSCMECSRIKSSEKYHADIEASRIEQKARREADPLSAKKKRERRRRLDPALAARQDEKERISQLKAKAIESGSAFYSPGLECSNGHIAERFVSNSKCRECNRERCESRSGVDRSELERVREHNRLAAAAKRAELDAKKEVRQRYSDALSAAKADGAKTYHGRPCTHGHGDTRYTSTSNCIECSAIKSASAEKKAYDKIYQEENKDKIQARTKAYQARTSEQRNITVRAWAKKNPEKRRAISNAYKHRRRAIEKAGSTTAELREWEASVKKDCYWCGKKKLKKYHVDHYQPLSKGGAHTVSNLVIACPRCNLTKSAKDPYFFAQSIGRLF